MGPTNKTEQTCIKGHPPRRTTCKVSRGAICAIISAALLPLYAHQYRPNASACTTQLADQASSAAAAGPTANSVTGAKHEAPQQCDPPNLADTPWSAHCQRLQRVCVDQGTLILYDERYQERSGRPAEPLPTIVVDNSKVYTFPWRDVESGNRARSNEVARQQDAEQHDSELRQGGSGSAEEPASRALLADPNMLSHQQQQRPEQQGHSQPLASSHTAQAAQPSKRRHEPLPLRAATSREATPYLAAPVFSNCTVPLVVYPIHADNFVHVFHDLASFLHALLRRTAWRCHAKLVGVTPAGVGWTPAEAQLLPPLTQLSVETWADFSRRLPQTYKPSHRGCEGAPPCPSWEGGHQRCFANLFVCGQRFRALRALEQRLPEGNEAAAQQMLQQAIPRENYAYGQMLVQYVQQQRRQKDSRGAPGQVLQPVAPVQGDAQRVWKVLFMKRAGQGRQLLNIQELLSRCNAWRYQPRSGGGTVAASCRQVELPSLEAGVAAAQEADVFVGMHGANLANAWLMRPGSSVVEVTPHQFCLRSGSFGLSHVNAQDPSSSILWWLAVVCDAAISQPGPDEAAGAGKPGWWPRDRSVRLPWEALEPILQDIEALGGDRQRYIEQRYRPWQHRFNVGAAGVLSRGVGAEGEHSC